MVDRPTPLSSVTRRRAAALAGAVLVAGLLAAPSVAAASPGLSHTLRAAQLHVLPDPELSPARTPQLAPAPATAQLKTYTAKVTGLGKTYSYEMVGTNPEAHSALGNSTTITALLVPLVVKFAGGLSWNPTAVDSCDPGATPLARTRKSPLFVNRAWTFGGTPVGTGQYIDAFERAEFWHYTKPGGTNPGYQLQLALKTLPARTVIVPTADSTDYKGYSCGNGRLADINFNWLYTYLRTTLMPSLTSAGVGPTTFPIFLVHNVAAYENNKPTDCCVLGYHDALSTASGIETYAYADYENSGAFNTTHDIQDLAHEVGEWVNDPLGTNPTPAWGHIGQQTACQFNLEVGDPLSGTAIPVALSGFTYHPQELAFFSWFYRQTPSLGVNGWYSDNGTLTTVQALCS
jgi:hypothetical protein